jgi:predicted HTH transcriptional regulator
MAPAVLEWSALRVNQRELALFRFIHHKTERELAKHFGRSKTYIHQSIERMVKDDFREANLTKEEKEKIR